MRFDDLDKRLRQYETAYDFCVPQENFIVVSLGAGAALRG